MRYAIVTEKAEPQSSADAPNLPDRIATGTAIPDVERERAAAIRLHLDGPREEGLTVPDPTSAVTHVES